jgi:hypothetical protein
VLPVSCHEEERFVVLSAMFLKIQVFMDVTLCRLENRRFEETKFLCLQDLKKALRPIADGLNPQEIQTFLTDVK